MCTHLLASRAQQAPRTFHHSVTLICCPFLLRHPPDFSSLLPLSLRQPHYFVLLHSFYNIHNIPHLSLSLLLATKMNRVPEDVGGWGKCSTGDRLDVLSLRQHINRLGGWGEQLQSCFNIPRMTETEKWFFSLFPGLCATTTVVPLWYICNQKAHSVHKFKILPFITWDLVSADKYFFKWLRWILRILLKKIPK